MSSPSWGVRSIDDAGEAVAAAPSFDSFVAGPGERLRRVLAAHYGVEVGNDVHADALAHAWEHWERVESMENPVGYLYRVAQSATRRHRRWTRDVDLPVERPAAVGDDAPALPVDAGLHRALAGLTVEQRTCIVLVHVYDWTYRDAAEALGLPVTTVRNHLHRGLARLRRLLEDHHDHDG